MEDFTWLLVSRMFIPLVEPVQPHNWEVFEWSPEFWARMGSKPKGKTTHPAQPVDHASQVKPLTATEQTCHDADAVGVFEL
jgi:hypothetical protein